MNPERNRGGMTVNALMQLGLFTSIGIPVVLLALLSWLSTSLDHFTLDDCCTYLCSCYPLERYGHQLCHTWSYSRSFAAID